MERSKEKSKEESALEAPDKPKCNTYEVMFKLVLIGTEAHFKTPGLLHDKNIAMTLSFGKEILGLSQKKDYVRQALGFSYETWTNLKNVFIQGVPVLEKQSFSSLDPVGPDYPGSSSTLIAANYAELLKNIERLNDLLIVSRNMLATKESAQDLAANAKFDQQILKLIDVCVKVTARGYDGVAGTKDEERWQRIVEAYKKLLITSLQFLHNFVMHNERRKLMLWLDLFGKSAHADPYFKSSIDPRGTYISDKPDVEIVESVKQNIDRSSDNPPAESPDVTPSTTSDPANRMASSLADKLDETSESIRQLRLDLNTTPIEQTSAVSETSAGDENGNENASSLPNPPDAIDTEPTKSEDYAPLLQSLTRSGIATSTPTANSGPTTEEDTIMGRTPASGAESLRLAKDQMMDRLRENIAIREEGEEQEYDVSDGGEEQDELEEGDHRGSDVAANGSVEDDEEDEDEYRGPGDQARGLLTDIPLVLGPTEIEALPMIIQTGIVSNLGMARSPEEVKRMQDMQAVRCNILLAQESGRNLLRELLIFIAAWDLRDDEFYVKMMMQIMEAILANGLMPFAYQTFAEAKDIISPAQAVVIKLLTHIFRAKQPLPPLQPAFTTLPSRASSAVPPPIHPGLARVDVLIIRYMFSVFRQSIIPETCALIYLQGQIRDGVAHPDDFPLNLWDMERVYEGVYQFLEFFAVLTESEEWKGFLVKWEISAELITLLRELDAGIPKGQLGADEHSGSATATAISQLNTPRAVSVERPYDTAQSGFADLGIDASAAAQAESDQQAMGPDDPAEFEWRNLKKLVVLVLSSLVWKSKIVQDQVRQYGGVEMVLNCCSYDGHNPYIREHAIMCLRFLLENNKENQQIVGELEARQVVPNEVFDKRGYEPYVSDGRVGLRRKDPVSAGN
ncbi:MAG: copper transport protein [Pycnora praestabilis]|nr:MAG: copper transport protein [Pycnora praestabilis]